MYNVIIYGIHIIFISISHTYLSIFLFFYIFFYTDKVEKTHVKILITKIYQELTRIC